MLWGRLGAAKKPIQTMSPVRAPQAKVSTPVQMMKFARMKERMKSQTNEAIMPGTRVFLCGTTLSKPRSFIHGLAKRGGEYQIAPRTQRMRADAKIEN